MKLTQLGVAARWRAGVDWWQNGILLVLLAILTAFIGYTGLSVLGI